MRLILLLLAATGLLALGGLAGYAAALAYIPYAATEALLDQFRANGRADNTLTRPNVRNARRNLVVRDNADTVTQAATIDLAAGPMVYETTVPADAVYWSVSLFAHNTDTYFVASDRDLKPGPFRLLIRQASQSSKAPFDREAISPTRFSYVIVRYTMPDRNDAASVEAIRTRQAASKLSPAS
ncbi:MAG: DUF1254 domain-containing protein [Phenylobacterium sp.]|jgi:hypothetical protein